MGMGMGVASLSVYRCVRGELAMELVRVICIQD